MKSGKDFKIQDQMIVDLTMKNLYPDLQAEFDKIDAVDGNEFVDGIDTDSISYKFYNSLNQIRYDYQNQISLQKDLTNSGPFKESKFISYWEKYQIQMPTLMFEQGFNVDSVVGPSVNGKIQEVTPEGMPKKTN